MFRTHPVRLSLRCREPTQEPASARPALAGSRAHTNLSGKWLLGIYCSPGSAQRLGDTNMTKSPWARSALRVRRPPPEPVTKCHTDARGTLGLKGPDAGATSGHELTWKRRRPPRRTDSGRRSGARGSGRLQSTGRQLRVTETRASCASRWDGHLRGSL